VKFSLFLESLSVIETDSGITLFDGDEEVGKIVKKTDDKGTYFKGSIIANPHYSGKKSTDEEMSISSALIKTKSLYKKYKDSLNDYVDKTDTLKNEYADLIKLLDSDDKTKANEFLKSLKTEDNVALQKAIDYIKQNLIKIKKEE
jgi:hypothetical protein